MGHCFGLTCGDGIGVGGVPTVRIGVERRDKRVIRDDRLGCEYPRSRDSCVMHGVPPDPRCKRARNFPLVKMGRNVTKGAHA